MKYPALDVGRAYSRQAKKLKYIIQHFTKMRTNNKTLIFKGSLSSMDIFTYVALIHLFLDFIYTLSEK